MALTCPPIYNSTIPQSIVTVDTINLVRTDTSDVKVGTVVNVSCYTGRTLTNPTTQNELTTAAEKKFTCVEVAGVARWDKTLPVCGVPTTNNNTTALTQQELIVIGVVAAVCCLVLILVIVMLCACWYKRRSQRRNKRPASEYSVNTGQFDGYKPYSMYAPFPGVYREENRPQYYSASLPRSATVLPESFPRPSQHSAYELASRSAVIRTKPYVGYAGPRVYKASSDTYEDYLAERNTGYYPGGRDNDGFRGEWSDRFDKKTFSDFNREAMDQGRDPFLWDRYN